MTLIPSATRRLLIRPGGIGDCLVSLPALESLRAGYTEVWVARQNVALIRFAQRARAIADTGLDLLEIPGRQAPPALIDSLRSFDSIVSWYGASRDEFRLAVERIGLPFHFLPALPVDPGRHAADFYLSQTGASLGAAPRIDCPRRGGDFAVLHPFSGSAAKNWPLERFQELAARLGRQIPVEWCAGPEEPLECAQRFPDLYELACWLARARVFIGNDSGTAHLAAAVGSPVVALFGPTDPRVWAPRGEKVRVVRTGQSLDGIAVDQVLAATASILCG